MVRICLPFIFALLVTLPGFTDADSSDDIYNQQPFYPQQSLYNNLQPSPTSPSWLSTNPAYSQQVPESLLQMPGQQLLGRSGQQPANQQMPLLDASPHSAQQNSASMQATISNLQTQLAAERTNEVQLVNAAAQKQQELQRANASFAHILTLAQTGAELEHELRRLLVNATAKNERLQAELRKVRDEALHNEGEVAKWQDEAKEAEHQVKQSAFLQKRADNVMQDVQAAQAKVRRTEQIIHSLLPRLEPQLSAPAAAANLHMASAAAVGGSATSSGPPAQSRLADLERRVRALTGL